LDESPLSRVSINSRMSDFGYLYVIEYIDAEGAPKEESHDAGHPLSVGEILVLPSQTRVVVTEMVAPPTLGRAPGTAHARLRTEPERL
jgi:hypothetical protein